MNTLSQIARVAEQLYGTYFVANALRLWDHPHFAGAVCDIDGNYQFSIGRDGSRLYIAKPRTFGETEDERLTAIFEEAAERMMEVAA